MKRPIHLALALALCTPLAAQRYVSEIFSDANITVTSDVIYGVNVDFLTSKLGAANGATIAANMAELQNAIDNGGPSTIPAGYFNPLDTNITKVKVTNLRMDIYQPNQSIDPVSNRPVVLYLHTGNALPPGVNGSPVGTRKDSSAVEICRRMARRGYVAVSMSYRLGWNPLGASIQVRRGTLLNAIYRAIHDVRQCVRVLKADAATSNTYDINPDKIVVLGEGTGGYISLANATLDRGEELFIDKFLVNPVPPISYVDTLQMGNLDGFNGFFCLYRPNGQNYETQFCVNLGGALADTSWLAAGDVPMVAFHTAFDPFAPFTSGIVIVPTTQEQVVEVQGSNLFMQRVNQYGNNSSFASLPSGDPYTNRARSLYGSTQTHGTNSVQILTNTEGLFPLVRPQWPAPAMEEASPWQWWDPFSAVAQTVVSAGPPVITAHIASMASNPDMSATKGRTYIDSIMGYMNPRIVCALQLGACSLVGIEENVAGEVNVWPNPATDNVNVTVANGLVRRYRLLDIDGRVVATGNPAAQRFVIERNGIAAGTYFIEFDVDGNRRVQKLMLD